VLGEHARQRLVEPQAGELGRDPALDDGAIIGGARRRHAAPFVCGLARLAAPSRGLLITIWTQHVA
jgi:hypothetical protein